jgi:cytochrome P450
VPTLDPVTTEEQIAAAEAAMRGWDEYTRELIAERRRKPGMPTTERKWPGQSPR